MSKINELSMVIDEMIACGEGLILAANKLKDVFSTDNLPEPQVLTLASQKALPTKDEHSNSKNYSKEDVRGILSSKSASGYGKEVKALLKKYGADKLSTLNPDDYASVVSEAEVIGNG